MFTIFAFLLAAAFGVTSPDLSITSGLLPTEPEPTVEVGLPPIAPEPELPEVVIVHGYNWDPVDVQPPQRMDWWIEPIQDGPYDGDISVDEFTQTCLDWGGEPTDLVGDVWVCQGIDY